MGKLFAINGKRPQLTAEQRLVRAIETLRTDFEARRQVATELVRQGRISRRAAENDLEAFNDALVSLEALQVERAVVWPDPSTCDLGGAQLDELVGEELPAPDAPLGIGLRRILETAASRWDQFGRTAYTAERLAAALAVSGAIRFFLSVTEPLEASLLAFTREE